MGAAAGIHEFWRETVVFKNQGSTNSGEKQMYLNTWDPFISAFCPLFFLAPFSFRQLFFPTFFILSQPSTADIIAMKIGIFILSLFVLFSTSHAIPLKEKRAYNGIFGKFCSAAVQRFSKFGKCLEQIPEFKQLSDSFWYKAAEKELCGSDVEFKMKFSATTRFSIKPSNSTTDLQISASELLQSPQNDTTSELEAQYLFDVKRELRRQQLSNSTDVPQIVFDSPKIHGIINREAMLANSTVFEKEATSTEVSFQPKVLTLTSTYPIVETLTQDPSGLNPEPSLQANFGKIQCMNLCDVIQSSSDEVKSCWANISLTVLYGVCEIGCLYYFVDQVD